MPEDRAFSKASFPQSSHDISVNQLSELMVADNDIITLEQVTFTMTRPIAAEQSHSDLEVLELLKRATNAHPPDQVLKKAVSILRENNQSYSWVGIYIVKGDNLVLAAYAGDRETEHVTIPIGNGICGLAAKQGETVIVPDVNKDPRYLMCFPSTRSEIVVPIKSGSRVWGEIDIDSDNLWAFTGKDQKLLEESATILASYLEKQPLPYPFSNQIT